MIEPTWICLAGPREYHAGAGEVPDGVEGIEVAIPIGTAGLRGLVTTAIEVAEALSRNPAAAGRELSMVKTKLDEVGLWLLADEMAEQRAHPAGLTDALMGI